MSPPWVTVGGTTVALALPQPARWRTRSHSITSQVPPRRASPHRHQRSLLRLRLATPPRCARHSRQPLGLALLVHHPQVKVVGDPHAGHQDRHLHQPPHSRETRGQADHVGILQTAKASFHVGALGILLRPRLRASNQILICLRHELRLEGGGTDATRLVVAGPAVADRQLRIPATHVDFGL
jgi:hypothetical protein